MYARHPLKNTPHSLSQSMKLLLAYWYRKRFVQRKDTSELMRIIQDQEDLRALSIVAMLDVDVKTMRTLLEAEEFRFIELCHAYLHHESAHFS